MSSPQQPGPYGRDYDAYRPPVSPPSGQGSYGPPAVGSPYSQQQYTPPPSPQGYTYVPDSELTAEQIAASGEYRSTPAHPGQPLQGYQLAAPSVPARFTAPGPAAAGSPFAAPSAEYGSPNRPAAPTNWRKYALRALIVLPVAFWFTFGRHIPTDAKAIEACTERMSAEAIYKGSLNIGAAEANKVSKDKWTVFVQVSGRDTDGNFLSGTVKCTARYEGKSAWWTKISDIG